MFPFVKEAVQSGYVVITPDYRGSTGYGETHYKMIDYGGKEVDDAVSSLDYLKTLNYVDNDPLRWREDRVHVGRHFFPYLGRYANLERLAA